MATLIREDVAYQGNHKSILPQHQRTDGDYAVTGEVNPLPTKVSGSDVMQPVDVQSHYQQMVQTHNAVSIAGGAYSPSVMFDTTGFNEVAVSRQNDANTASTVELIWSFDGVNRHGYDIMGPNSVKNQSISVPTKARYLQLIINNGDATVAHTMSAWIYMKA